MLKTCAYIQKYEKHTNLIYNRYINLNYLYSIFLIFLCPQQINADQNTGGNIFGGARNIRNADTISPVNPDLGGGKSDNVIAGENRSKQNHGSLPWRKFDVKTYLAKTAVKIGEDGYVRNKFNQIESDKVAIDRSVPDTRQTRYVDDYRGS